MTIISSDIYSPKNHYKDSSCIISIITSENVVRVHKLSLLPFTAFQLLTGALFALLLVDLSVTGSSGYRCELTSQATPAFYTADGIKMATVVSYV